MVVPASNWYLEDTARSFIESLALTGVVRAYIGRPPAASDLLPDALRYRANHRKTPNLPGMTCKERRHPMTSPVTSPNQFVESRSASSVVFVIDNDTSLRRSLDALPHDTRWRIQAVASLQALRDPRWTFAPSCLLLDVSRPDCDLWVSKWPPNIPVICITDAGDVSLCVKAMKAGAVDVLTKPVYGAPLLEAIRLALGRSEERIRREVELNVMRERYASLSRREREVMTLIASGRLNKQVANDLGISVITVKAHRGRVMRKMQAKSLASLVMMAIMLQLTGHRIDTEPRGARSRPPSAVEIVLVDKGERAF